MKIISTYPKTDLFMLALLCAAIASSVTFSGTACAAGKPSPAPAAKSQAAGRLVIVRSANLGSTIVGLKIDGVQTAKISYTQRYDAPLAAGPHILTVIPMASAEAPRSTEKRITVEPGKTYTFTAKREDIQLVLK